MPNTKLIIKTCKHCEKKRYGNLSICYFHHREREKEKREEKKVKKLDRKLKTKKYQASEKKKWHKKAWNIFSKYVRRRSADFRGYTECYTCLKQFDWKELHAGHRHHNKLDFDERNINPQCAKCNTYLHGNLGNYERHLIEDYGLEEVKKLEQKANQHKGYSTEDLKTIFEKYTELYNQL
jgi:hypothetical protein